MLKRSALDLQEKLMQTWPGDALDSRGIVRFINSEGTKPPIFWIFNAPHGAKALSRFLGPDQPLIFTRSTTLMFPDAETRTSGAEAFSKHVLPVLKANIDYTELRVGTACEGNKLLSLICVDLQKSGVQIPALYLINCSLVLPALGLPALLIYGDEDPRHDPFRDPSRDAEKEAASKFSIYQRVVLPAQHSKYFTPKNIRAGWDNYEKLLAQLSDKTSVNSETVG